MVMFVVGVLTTAVSSGIAATTSTYSPAAGIITALGVAVAGVIVAVTGLVKVLRRMDGAAKLAEKVAAAAAVSEARLREVEPRVGLPSGGTEATRTAAAKEHEEG